MKNTLTIALSKGRIFKETLPMLAHAGITPVDDPETSRKLILDTNRDDVKLVIIRASTVPTYVQYGAAAIGVAGKDVLMEHGGEGLYEPLIGGPKMAQMTGRPTGAKKPKEEDKKTPIGTKAALNFSLSRIQEHLNLSDKLNLEVEASLRQIHKRKRLSKQQKEVAREITNIVIANEDPPNWLAKAGMKR